MTLFVILPFVGGWIGYQYAPEKIVEAEREVIKEVPAESFQFDIQFDNSETVVNAEKNLTLPDNWITYTNDTVSFKVSYPDGYDTVIKTGNRGGSDEPSFHLFDDSLPDVEIFRELIGGPYCFDHLCDREVIRQSVVNEILWDYVGESIFCEVGLCSPTYIVYRTIRGDFRYYFFIEKGAEELEKQILATFVFK